MGSVSVSSCRCCMLVSRVHPVAVPNAAFCMTCSLLMLVEDAIDDHQFLSSTVFTHRRVLIRNFNVSFVTHLDDIIFLLPRLY